MASPRCPSCTDTGTKSCAGCKSITYCSQECQIADWPFHKNFCTPFKKLAPRPSEEHRLVVFFPEQGDKPEFKWVQGFPCDRNGLFGEEVCMQALPVQENKITGADLGRDICLYYNASSAELYEDFNETIEAVAAYKLKPYWRGPVLAVCSPRDSHKEADCMLDMDMLSCSDLAAFLLDLDNDLPVHQLRQERKKVGKVQAVKATCHGEQALNGVASYIPVKVPIMHPISEDGKADVADLSQAVEMPLLTWKYPKNKNWPQVRKRESNVKVTNMHKGIDPKASGIITRKDNSFGWAPLKWSQSPGNVLVTRQDFQPITPDEVDAFGDFCWHHLNAYFQLCLKRRGRAFEATAEAMIAAEASAPKWKVYYEDWRNVKAGIVDDPEVEGRVDGKIRIGFTKKDGDALGSYLLDTYY